MGWARTARNIIVIDPGESITFTRQRAEIDVVRPAFEV